MEHSCRAYKRNVCQRSQSLACVKVFTISLLLCNQFQRIRPSDPSPPRIIKGPPMNVVYRESEAILLDCIALGQPAPRYSWTKDGSPLMVNMPHGFLGPNGRVLIISATTTDEGYYQCIAQNPHGTALSNTSSVQRAYLDTEGSYRQVTTVVVEEGNPFNIRAVVSKSFPEALVHWEVVSDYSSDKSANIQSQPLETGNRVQIDQMGNLWFAHARPEDALENTGMYRDIVYNPRLNASTNGSSHTKVTVLPRGTNFSPPEIAFSSPSAMIVVEGRVATLACFFSGNPVPTVDWAGPDEFLPIGRHRLEKFNTRLRLYGMTKADEGIYICRGSNSEGSSERRIHLLVQAAPEFRFRNSTLCDTNASHGSNVTFRCDSYAEPEATVDWFVNGRRMISTDFSFSTLVEISPDGKQLQLMNVCHSCNHRISNMAVVQCNASNVHGYAFGTAILNVLAPEEAHGDLSTDNDADGITWYIIASSIVVLSVVVLTVTPVIVCYRIRRKKETADIARAQSKFIADSRIPERYDVVLCSELILETATLTNIYEEIPEHYDLGTTCCQPKDDNNLRSPSIGNGDVDYLELIL